MLLQPGGQGRGVPLKLGGVGGEVGAAVQHDGPAPGVGGGRVRVLGVLGGRGRGGAGLRGEGGGGTGEVWGGGQG